MRTAGLDTLLALPRFEHLDIEGIRELVSGFASISSEIIAPTDRIGDREGATLDADTSTVRVPPEVAEAFHRYVQGGWQAVSAPEADGGGGLPSIVASAVHEMFGSANLALSLNPMLTQSAIELLEQWADERQRRLVLHRLIAGEWTGTMNLTEPDAGSDLGAVRTHARPRSDGQWTVTGTKIFITWGDHELTENIAHLVLARTPGAPEGTRGVSVFLVPKFEFDDDGTVGRRNGIFCRSLEHKLGIHASPTCVMEFVDAVAELVGPLHGGMNVMFSMMNPARLAVGIQGVSVAERALQQAVSYAAVRRQGRIAGRTDAGAIIEHPDVQRMLVEMATTTDAARLLTYATAIAGDMARHHPDPTVRTRFQRRADLLTPLAKAWPTDRGERVASLAIQVHGGMGFMEESGVPQRYRDVRITSIYEGTNGIQAIDLVGRKVARDGGLGMRELLDDVGSTLDVATSHVDLHRTAGLFGATLESARSATTWVVDKYDGDRRSVLAGASSYLNLVALLVSGQLLVERALSDLSEGRSTARRSISRAEFFAAYQLQQQPTTESITFGASLLADALDTTA
jgi:alkylation response protein AidB-like acyl-CoA dehydrogenase